MEDLRIMANNLDQKSEIITMLIDIGYKRGLFLSCDSDYLMGIHAYSSGEIQDVIDEDYNCKRHKEITIQQLRDLVILKRNDVDDECTLTKWDEYQLRKQLKPIKKEMKMKMKEYLRKNQDGVYVLELSCEQEAQEPHAKHWIEVPDGAECAVIGSEGNIYFWNSNKFIGGIHDKWVDLSAGHDVDWYLNTSTGSALVWQRSESEKQAEACENKHFSQCIPVPESAWDKQTGGCHYKKLAIQPMEYALKNKLDYAQANVVKYVTRHADKNGKEDLLKAIHNIELMIEHYYS